MHGSVQVEKHVSKSCIGDLLTWVSGENTQISCNHGFDVGPITPSATGVEVFRAISKNSVIPDVCKLFTKLAQS